MDPTNDANVTRNITPTILGSDDFDRTLTVNSGIHNLSWDDATWILTSSFIVFTMQTGQ